MICTKCRLPSKRNGLCHKCAGKKGGGQPGHRGSGKGRKLSHEEAVAMGRIAAKNPNFRAAAAKNGASGWAKGTHGDPRILKAVNASMDKLRGKPGRPQTETTRNKLSIIKTLHPSGGYKSIKWFSYTSRDGKSVKLQGTYEVKVAKCLDDLGIKWIAHPTALIYYNSLKKRYARYCPDFLIKDRIYLEIKGHWWGNDKQKMKDVMLIHDNIIILEGSIAEIAEQVKALV